MLFLQGRFLRRCGGHVFTRGLGKFPKNGLLRRAEVFRRHNPNRYELVAAPLTADIGDAEPLKAKDRAGGYPLVIGGGIALTLNPEPLADFFDLFILGEQMLQEVE